MSKSLSLRLLSLHRQISLLFVLLMSWSLWTGIMAFYADLVRPWLRPELAAAFLRPAPDPLAALAHVGAAVETERGAWTLIFPSELRPFFVFAGPAGVAMVHGETGVQSPWNNDSADGVLRRLHTDLLLAKPYGRFLMGLAGLLLGLVVLTGVFIHGKVIHDAWRWRRSSTLVDFSDSHKRFGFWLLPYFLVMALSGAVLGMKTISQPLAAWMASGFDARAAQALLRDGPGQADPRGGAVKVGACLAAFQTTFPDARLGRMVRRDDVLMLEAVPFGRLIWAGDGAGGVRGLCRAGQVTAVRDVRAQAWPEIVESALRPVHYGRFGGIGTAVLYIVLGLGCLWVMDTGMRLLWLRDRAGQHDWARRLYRANTLLYALAPPVFLGCALLTGAVPIAVLVAVIFIVLALFVPAGLAAKCGAMLRPAQGVLGVLCLGLPLLRLVLMPHAPWWGVWPVMVVDASLVLFGLFLIRGAAWFRRGCR